MIGALSSYAVREFIRKSILSVGNGESVIDTILGGGKFKRVLEIGTYRGVSAAYMSQYCEWVTTVDLKNGKMESDNQVFDRVRFWQALGINNITLRLADNDSDKAAIIKDAEFDFAFVDGDHEGLAPRVDFEMVRRCGTVLFHDFDGENGVRSLVQSLPRHQVTDLGMFALWTDRA